MPAIMSDPSRTVLDTQISITSATTIAKVATLCGAISLSFSAVAVLTSIERCIEHSLKKHPAAKQSVGDLLQGVKEALVELANLGMVDPVAYPGFISDEKPVLKMLTRLPNPAPDELVEALGNMLISAYLTTNPPSSNRIARLSSVSSAVRKEPTLTPKQFDELQTLLQRSQKDLIETIAQTEVTFDRSVLKFNADLLIHFRSDLNSENVRAQQCANPRAYMERQFLAEKIHSLMHEAAEGESSALIALVAFSINLRWDLVLRLPLQKSDMNLGSVMWIDVSNGLVHVCLKQLLCNLGKAVKGCETTSDTLRLNLPQTLTQQLQRAALHIPTARNLGDFIHCEPRSARSLTECWSDSQRAKFIRSAPSVALQIQPNRAVASYAFAAFHLLTEPDLPYITVSEEQIWSMRSDLFETVGLGQSVPTEHVTPGNVGSRRTPERETLGNIFEELRLAVIESKVGRRYSLESLIAHHNCYARWTAMYLQFVAGGRATKNILFTASSWFPGSAFGYSSDKEVGAACGRTPIPIAPQTALQLKLYFLHLQSLQNRLEKLLGITGAKPAKDRIQSILKANDVPLLFFIGSEGVPQLISASDLFIGRAANLNHDFGRHFIPTALTQNGNTLASSHGFLRHQGEGINPQSAFGIEIQHDRLNGTSLALESVLLSLGLQPLAGLVRGKL